MLKSHEFWLYLQYTFILIHLIYFYDKRDQIT